MSFGRFSVLVFGFIAFFVAVVSIATTIKRGVSREVIEFQLLAKPPMVFVPPIRKQWRLESMTCTNSQSTVSSTTFHFDVKNAAGSDVSNDDISGQEALSQHETAEIILMPKANRTIPKGGALVAYYTIGGFSNPVAWCVGRFQST